MNKVVIIGCGNVGMSYAYALLNQKTNVQELALIDMNQERIIGEVMDLNHCLAFAPSKINIYAGTYEDCRDAAMVVIAAGANQNPGETRMDLIHKNSIIFKDIVTKVMESGFHGIFLVATNPVDIMTHLTWKYSKLDHKYVIGSGTTLDTARLRYMIGDKLGINPKNVHAYVMGEHGDTEFVPWSNATVGLKSARDFLSEEELNQIYVDVRDAAYEVIERKGATYYGIGMCLVRITNAILGDENSIMTVSSYDETNGVYFGRPTIIYRNGVKDAVFVNLEKDEETRLRNSIETLKQAMNDLE